MLDILDFAERVRHHVPSPESLREELACHAALYELAIIGEAASRLSATVRDTHPEVPWARIVGLRNILVHVYDDVRLDLVWDAIRQLPDLEATVRSILEELPEP